MPDVVVTVPQRIWADWLAEGDCPGDEKPGVFPAYDFTCAPASSPKPPIEPGERVYVIAHGRVRGYAPLVEVIKVEGRWSLVRAGGAVACTIPEPVRGFQGWRVRWWDRAVEQPFPLWRIEGVVLACCACSRKRAIAGYMPRDHAPLCAWCVVKAVDEARSGGKTILPGWQEAYDFAAPIVERARNVDEYDALAAEQRR